jgi:hypothetical protein
MGNVWKLFGILLMIVWPPLLSGLVFPNIDKWNASSTSAGYGTVGAIIYVLVSVVDLFFAAMLIRDIWREMRS